MRVLSQTELSRCTKAELYALLRKIAAMLPELPENSQELRNAHANPPQEPSPARFLNRSIVQRLTLYERASNSTSSPAASLCNASWRVSAESFGGRPNRTPRARALALPAAVRRMMSSRVLRAIYPTSAARTSPSSVVVSAQGSARDLYLAPRSANSCRTLSILKGPPRVSLSSAATMTVSPALRQRMSRLSASLSSFAPLSFSQKIFVQPAARNCANCMYSFWPLLGGVHVNYPSNSSVLQIGQAA